MDSVTSKNGHSIREFSKGWSEDLPREANPHVIWKQICGKNLTSSQAVKLLQGQKIKLKGLVSRAGRTFDCEAIYDFSERKIIFIFPEKEAKPEAQTTRTIVPMDLDEDGEEDE